MMSNAIADLLPVDGVGVDVGAKIDGEDWVRSMLGRSDFQGKVYAFEPDEEGFTKLAEVYGNNPRVILEKKAVADRDGVVRLNHRGTHLTLVNQGGREAEGVTLDVYFQDIKVDLLKIDVEGGEYRVLQGARRLCRDNPQLVLVLEVHPNALLDQGILPGQLSDLVEQLGYGQVDVAGLGEGQTIVCRRVEDT